MSTKRKNLGEAQAAAADVLGEIAETAIPKTAIPETGKPGLPEPEPENGHDDYEEDTDDENQSAGKEVTHTQKDWKDLVACEANITGGKRQVFESFRAIRWRQLWRLILDNEGKQLYSSFDEYCEDRWGHTRQWVTHGTNWLRIMEELESLGFPVPHLTVKAAQGLLSDRLAEAGGLRAVLEEAKEDGVPLDRDHLRQIVVRRADYFTADEDDDRRPAAKSYTEYKADLATLDKLGSTMIRMTDYGIFDEARKRPGMLSDNLVQLCKAEAKLPAKQLLLAAFTGDVLDDVVSRLQEIVVEADEIETKKNLLKAKKKQLKEGQAGIRVEVKTLEKELTAKGVLKKKEKVPQAKLSPDPDEAGHETGHEDEKTEEENQDGEVLHALKMAEEYFDEAMESDEWPAAELELKALLEKAQDCEIKLADITAKVKELLVDVPQPEALPSGDN